MCFKFVFKFQCVGVTMFKFLMCVQIRVQVSKVLQICVQNVQASKVLQVHVQGA